MLFWFLIHEKRKGEYFRCLPITTKQWTKYSIIIVTKEKSVIATPRTSAHTHTHPPSTCALSHRTLFIYSPWNRIRIGQSNMSDSDRLFCGPSPFTSSSCLACASLTARPFCIHRRLYNSYFIKYQSMILTLIHFEFMMSFFYLSMMIW